MTEDIIKKLMDEFREDFEDFAANNPDLVQRWKAAKTMNDDGSWDSPEDAYEIDRMRAAAYDHYRSRHPEAEVKDMSKAYAAYTRWIRGYSFY